jgi:hypothetical protein
MTTTLELAGRSRMTTDVARPNMPILIQVPSLRAPDRRRPGPARRRRRLRKEVRFAGLTMMSVLPAGLLLLALGGAHPAERPLRASTPAVVALADASAAPALPMPVPGASDEIPQAEAPAAVATDAVVFHDYLLPVDGPEEPDHAGR